MERFIPRGEDIAYQDPTIQPIFEYCKRYHPTIVVFLRAMGREMGNEWDLGVKAACLSIQHYHAY